MPVFWQECSKGSLRLRAGVYFCSSGDHCNENAAGQLFLAILVLQGIKRKKQFALFL